jgi:DNA-binding NarL/FixJ family response regulator
VSSLIRLVVADDHPVFLAGLQSILDEAAGFHVAAAVSDGEAAMAAVAACQPDVVLMDLRMPGGGGARATARICAAEPHPAVLVLTMSDDDDSVFAALRAGARGYLLKESSSEDITRAVRSVARGEAVFGPKIADRVVGFFAAAVHGRGPEPFPQLTAREREILDLLARGWDNLTIARRLVVSDKTVRNHVSAVLTKLQVASRAEAVALARDAGIGPDQLPTGSSTGQRPGRNPPDPAVAGRDPALAGRAGPAADAGRRVTGIPASGLSLVLPRKPGA